jgi:hypothetical protein
LKTNGIHKSLDRPGDSGVANFERVNFDLPESVTGDGSINGVAAEGVWVESAKGQFVVVAVELEGEDGLGDLTIGNEIFKDSRHIEDAGDREAQSQQAVGGPVFTVQVVSRSQATNTSENVLRESFIIMCGLNS